MATTQTLIQSTEDDSADVRVSINIYTFSNVKYLRLVDLEALKSNLEMLDSFTTPSVKDILSNVLTCISTILRVNYYSMVAPSKMRMFPIGDSIEFFIDYETSKLKELLDQLQFGIGPYGSKTEQIDWSSQCLDIRFVSNAPSISEDHNLCSRVSQLETDMDLMKILTRSSVVTYDYEAIKKKMASLNIEFRRVFRLLNSSRRIDC